MNPEKINFAAYQYAEAVKQKFDILCDPLFHFNIKVFAYFRFFPNGRYFCLCNRLDWLKFCLDNVHSNDDTALGEEIGVVTQDDYHCFLWPTEKTDYLMKALFDFEIWNGVSVFKKNADYIELWGFATDRTAENMKSFYIENIEALKDFSSSFSINASEITAEANNNLSIYKNFKSALSFDEHERKEIEQFIKSTPIKKIPLFTGNGELFLSKKEINCLNSVACGKSSKHIALTDKVSVRTVEKHIENIKRKIGVKNKSDLISIYKNSILNWL